MSETKYTVSITHACKYNKYNKNNIHNCTKQNIYYNEYKIASFNEHKYYFMNNNWFVEQVSLPRGHSSVK